MLPQEYPMCSKKTVSSESVDLVKTDNDISNEDIKREDEDHAENKYAGRSSDELGSGKQMHKC